MKKISSGKALKIIDLFMKGYIQIAISKMLHIDQSTVSKYIGKFKALSEQKGMEAALAEFEVKDQFEETQTVANELKKSGLTIADVHIALQIEMLLQQCGVKHEGYKDLIQACLKVKEGGWVKAALNLNQLENDTGLTYQKILVKASSTYEQLQKSREKLQKLNGDIEAIETKKTGMEKQEKQAVQNYNKHMQQIDMDEGRLKKVEALALALTKAKIPDQALPEYIKSQELLNKSGITINLFAGIVEKAGVACSLDHGKQLLKLLEKYGGLVGAINALQAEKQLLVKETSSLKEQVTLKDNLQGEIDQLEADRDNLELEIDRLQKEKNELDEQTINFYKVLASFQSLTQRKASLEQENSQKQAFINALDGEIKTKQDKMKDLSELESKHELLEKGIAELEARRNHEKARWQAFEGFIGIVQAHSMEDLKHEATVLLDLLPGIVQDEYSPEFIKNYIFKDLAGPGLQILKCTSCQARFSIDKPAPTTGYQCPICGSGHTVTVEKDASELLTGMLDEPKQGQFTIKVGKVPVVKKPQNEKSSE